jgi:hypothetical protein
MGLVPLPNLYCLPSDVMDYLGVEGTQLRLDDHLMATGQRITVWPQPAVQGATTVNVAALSSPILSGTVLEFDGAGMAAVSEVTTAQTAALGSTLLTVNPLAAALPVNAQAADSGVNLALAQRLVKGCQYATSRVKLYCCSRYDDSALATCWTVNRWATSLAAQWVCKRRAQAAPKGVEDDVEDTMEEMRRVKAGQLQLEDVGTRTSAWPTMSNVTVQVGWDYSRVRVQQPISEPTPTQYAQFVDWNSVLAYEW